MTAAALWVTIHAGVYVLFNSGEGRSGVPR
jgi:hypothetical protein